MPAVAGQAAAMTAETLRELIHKAPFAPFHIRMDNGATHLVRHPDYLFLVPGGHYAVVAEDNNRFHILDIPHISAVTVSETAHGAAGPAA